MSQVVDAGGRSSTSWRPWAGRCSRSGSACTSHGSSCRGFAWRNILAASFPSVAVRRLPVLGAYLAGVGLNSVAPARAGDVLKLVLVHTRIEGSTYSTLTPTLIVETLFDIVVAAGVLIWAFQQDVLPGLDVLRRPKLSSVDWHWPLEHPQPAIVIGLVWVT